MALDPNQLGMMPDAQPPKSKKRRGRKLPAAPGQPPEEPIDDALQPETHPSIPGEAPSPSEELMVQTPDMEAGEPPEPPKPAIDYADETNIKDYVPQETDRKRIEKFTKRWTRLKDYHSTFQRKFDKNNRYFRGFRPGRYEGEELWRSDVFVPSIGPRIKAYEARMNDRIPEPLCEARTPDGVEKAKKKEMALQYVLDMCNAPYEFAQAKSQGLKYGTGFIGVFYDDSVRIRRNITGMNPDGTPIIEEVEEPLHKEPVLVRFLDAWDVYVDPNATNIDNADDCVIRTTMSTEEARRRFWDFGNKLGQYIRSGMGDTYDSRASRAEITKILAQEKAGPPIILPDGQIKRYFSDGAQHKMQGEVVEILYYYNQRKDVYQIWCGNLCLLDMPNPYKHGKLPIAPWRDEPLDGEFYGQGEVDLLEKLQDMLNEIRNSRLDQVRLSTFKTILLSPQAGIKKDDLQVGPLKVIPVRDATQVTTLNIPPVGGEIYKEEDLIRQDMETTSGLSDNNIGAEQRATDTATGENIQIQSAQERLNEKVRKFEEEMFVPALRLLSDTIAQFWDQPKIIAVTGEQGSIEEEIINPDDLTSEVNIKCQAGTGQPPNKLAIREQFLQLFNLVSQNPNVVADEMLRELFGQFDIKNVDDFLVSRRQYEMLRHAESENQQLAIGNQQPVKEVYVADHQIHLSKHMEALNLPEFQTLEPGIQQMFVQHIQEHQEAMPIAPGQSAGGGPTGNPSSPLAAPSDSSVPPPSNVQPVNPVVQPGPDALGVPQGM